MQLTRTEELEEERIHWFSVNKMNDTIKNKIDYYESLRSNLEFEFKKERSPDRHLTLFAVTNHLLILKMQQAIEVESKEIARTLAFSFAKVTPPLIGK